MSSDDDPRPLTDVWTVWGAVALTGLATVAAVLEGPTWLRLLLGLPAVLACPGLLLVAAWESWRPPAAKGLDGTARIALWIGLSVAWVPFVVLLTDAATGGLDAWRVGAALCVTAVLLAAAATWSPRRAVPHEESHQSERDLRAAVRRVGPVAVAALGVALLFLWGADPDQEPFTEMALLDETGMAAMNLELVEGDAAEVSLWLHNQEQSTTTYHVQVWSEAGQFEVPLDGPRRFVVANVTSLAAWNVTLEHGETWQEAVTVAPPVGDHRIRFVADVDGQGSPYRSNHLYATVTAAGGA
ncbi:MAG: DUF1616 domain-containing protein [Thermoplasmatota archaeon]